jgi:hypothetical protein
VSIRGTHLWLILAALAALALSGLIGGCAALTKPPAGPTSESYRDAALLDPATDRLVVEIDYLAGGEPHPRALRIFARRLAFYCDKPGGVSVEVGDEIPVDRWEESRDRIVELTREFAGGPTDDAAYLYGLYAPAYKTFRGYSFRRGVLEEDIDYPVIIAFSSQLKPILWLTGVRQQASVLVHEAGHVLGLVTDDGHRDGGHCTNSWCLMYDGVDARSLFVNLLPVLFTGYLPTHYCDDCRADLWGDERVPGQRSIPGLPTPEQPGCDPVWGDESGDGTEKVPTLE